MLLSGVIFKVLAIGTIVSSVVIGCGCTDISRQGHYGSYRDYNHNHHNHGDNHHYNRDSYRR